MDGGAIWQTIGYGSHLGAAIICAALAAWIGSGRNISRTRKYTCVALVLTAAWALIAAALSPFSVWALAAECARNLGWLLLLYSLFVDDGRHSSIQPIRPVLFVLVLLELAQPALAAVMAHPGSDTFAQHLVFQISVILQLLVTVGALLLVHNLFAGASAVQRPRLRWSAAALATLWVVDLNYYTVAYLSNGVTIELAALRGIVVAMAVIPLAVGAMRGGTELRFMPSRAVTFRTLSLFIIGLYLLAMVGIARSLTWIGGDLARLTQVAFVFTASLVALLWLPSQRLRRWLKVTLLKHLFQHRYDYREEWLRLTHTVGRTGPEAPPLQERVVQALADITESPSGLLFAPADDGAMTLAARWKWPGIDVPAVAMEGYAVEFFATGHFICDLDDVRAGANQRGEANAVPGWLLDNDQAWAIVPLQHYDRLTGLVVLARPEFVRKLDWEDFDLLRVVGQQLASYMAEQAGQEALSEANRFDEFNRRIAFVMHDIKNLASQLSLLARNAEKHVEKPEFRADMLITLRNSADKLNALLARLGRYGAHGGERLETVSLDECVAHVAARYSAAHRIQVVKREVCLVQAQREALEQALVHLIQNAVDASADDAPVFLSVSNDGLYGLVQIVDSGTGMSPDFVRSRLFKPFVSSKPGGFGIGAFEARELIAAMGGRLEVESREGLGTRFFVRLPRTEVSSLIAKTKSSKAEVA
ncbi:putative two-component histidine kinase [Caenibius tardaugens NBRC 16725]|uniref:histidine kinase n=1 Tax=Caenibius tardaugens NBRC 16725 TaxID=1219035 RepID=U2ZPN5_9SPHN|nr:XrtA/PEP-CTERM system histidine kinase PrsK [Caenibius tardaugens]AZI37421.1 PEP-CTERM system histidine kinase PrsK [Caenibius tardaugens NBRC 16725]GAD47309.1 putative two-component histidine kinase [Caenibius tardaugens NBRC 16725]